MIQRIRVLLILVVLFAISMVGSLSLSAEKKPKERLAVLDLESKYGVDKGLAEALSVIVRDKLHSYGDYQVMSKGDLQAVASREQLKQAMGCDDGGSQCLLDFGRAIGTRYMVAGDISKIGSTFTVSLRMLDTKGDSAGVTNRVSENCKCEEDALIGTVQDVAAKLIGKPTSLAAKILEEEKKLTEEKKKSEEAEQKLITQEKKHTAELLKKTEAEASQRLAEEQKKTEEYKKQFAAEAERLKNEKEFSTAEAEGNKLALEKQKTDEVENQRIAEESRLKVVAETEKLKQEKANTEAEWTRLAQENKRLKNETSKRMTDENKKKDEAENEFKSVTSLQQVEQGQDTSRDKHQDASPDLVTKASDGSLGKTIVSLRAAVSGKTISENTIHDIINKFNFYDRTQNPNGEFHHEFIAMNPELVVDKVTGLMWQSSGSVEKLDYRDAVKYIQKLNSDKNNGYVDWRLPTIEELSSLLQKTENKNHYSSHFFSPQQLQCWSNDKAPSYGDLDQPTAWIVDFRQGIITKAGWWEGSSMSPRSLGSDPYNEKNYVRAVRSAGPVLK